MVENSIYDSYAMHKFMGLNFLKEQTPDATTFLQFRHLIENHGIGKQLFNAIKCVLKQGGCMMKGGSIVDAALISTPSRKTAYRGLAKNHNRLYMLFLSANPWMCAKSGNLRYA